MSDRPHGLRVLDGGRPQSAVSPPPGHSRCRYAQRTVAVPEGRLVRRPLCPRCGLRLGYAAGPLGARYIHLDDPRFRLDVAGGPDDAL